MKAKFIVLLMLLIVVCLISNSCTYANSKPNKKDNELENEKEAASHNSESTDPPLENHMNFHSWEELKRLCDAAQGNSDEFLASLKMLDEQYCNKEHLWFDAIFDKTRYKDAFLDIYNGIKDQKLIVLKDQKKDQETIPFDDVCISRIEIRRPSDRVYASIFYQCDFADEIIYFTVRSTGNYTNLMGYEEGDPLIKVDGEDYSANVWLVGVSRDSYQNYHVYITEDGNSSPSFYVTLSSSKIRDFPSEALLFLISEFRITTIEDILTDNNS